MTLPAQLRLASGEFVSTACPDCGYGVLQPTGDGDWTCDGLADPEHRDKALVYCTRQIVDGILYPHAKSVRA